MEKFKWESVILLSLIALLSNALSNVKTNTDCSESTDPLAIPWEILPFSFINLDLEYEKYYKEMEVLCEHCL